MAERWQDPAFLIELAAIAAILTAVVTGLLYIWRWAGFARPLHAKLADLPGDVADVNLKVSVLVIEAANQDQDPAFYDKLKALGKQGGNPYDLDRRNALLDKMRAGTIILEEAQELQRYLQEDAARLTVQRDPSATAALSGLGTAASFVYLLSGQACDVNRAFDHAFPETFRTSGWKRFEPGPHQGTVREVGISGPMEDGRVRYGPRSFLLCERHLSVIKDYDHMYRTAHPGAQSALPVSERHD